MANPVPRDVGLRVEPGEIGVGVELRLDVAVESIPLYVFKASEVFRQAVEATVRETLRQGLFGWKVTDCTVTMTAFRLRLTGARLPGTSAC